MNQFRSFFPLFALLIAPLHAADKTLSDYASFEAAVDALNAPGSDVTLVIDKPVTVAASRTINQNITLNFVGAGLLSTHSGATLTIKGAIQSAERQIFGSTASVALPNIGTVWARWFGAKGDGTTNDAPSINQAILAAQASNNATVQLGAGIFALESTLVMEGANRAINITGVPGSIQQGSARNVTHLRWQGGAYPMLSAGVTFGEIAWMTFDNHSGEATTAITYPKGAGRSTLDHVTFFSTPNKSWGTAAVVTPSFDYTTWRNVQGLAGPFLRFGPNRGTTGLSVESSMFEDVTKSDKPWFLIDGGIERLAFSYVSWIIYRPDAVVLRTTETSRPWHLSIENCEYDDNTSGHSGGANAIWLDLNNVRIADIARTTVYGGGQATALVRLTKSRLALASNTIASLKYLVTATDQGSAVYAGQNIPAGSATAAVSDATVRSAQVVTVPVQDGGARLHGTFLNPSAHVLFKINAADAKNFAVTWAQGGDTDWGFMSAGQLFTVMIRNTTAAALANVTFPPTHFKASGPFISPAPGKNRSITFVHDGSHAVEVWRASADVDN